MPAFAHRTQVTAVGGHTSAVASADGALKVQLSNPRAPNAPGPNAEQLLASALAASFLERLKDAALEAGLVLAPDANVTVTLSLTGDLDTAMLSASLDVDLPGLARGEVLALVRRARRTCPYARLLPGRLDIQVSVL